MKRLGIILIAVSFLLLMGGMFLPGMASASLSISNTPDSWSVGSVSLGSSYTSGNLTVAHFTVTNDGTEAVDITISGTDMTGAATWTLSSTGTPGASTYALKAGLEGYGDYNVTVKGSAPYNTLISGLTASDHRDWDLKIWTPTSSSSQGEETGSVTLTASLA